MTILHLDASPRRAGSLSRQAGEMVVLRLQRLHPGAAVLRRDLGLEPPPYVDERLARAMLMPAEARGAVERTALALSESLIGELETTDLLVIATPMHNYTVPAPLKAWLDHVVRIGRSFRSTPAGKVGLLRDRPAMIVTAAGGRHIGEEARQPDFLLPYLRAILATIGIRNVRFLSLQGTARAEQAEARALAEAAAWIERELAPALLPDRS